MIVEYLTESGEWARPWCVCGPDGIFNHPSEGVCDGAGIEEEESND